MHDEVIEHLSNFTPYKLHPLTKGSFWGNELRYANKPGHLLNANFREASCGQCQRY